MKRTLALLFGVLVMLGTLLFVNHLPTQAQNDTTAANVAVVQRFYDEFSAGNADVILTTHIETITMHYAGEAGDVPAQILCDDLSVTHHVNGGWYPPNPAY